MRHEPYLAAALLNLIGLPCTSAPPSSSSAFAASLCSRNLMNLAVERNHGT